jgi:hypothetical protein
MTTNCPSSCNCNNKTYECQSEGHPTNLSVRNCNISPYFDCYNKQPFLKTTGPNPKDKGVYVLNPQLMNNQYAKDFKGYKCPSYGCPDDTWVSLDPRLISASHSGQMLTLDAPPIESGITLSEINTDKSLNNYGKNYGTYSDINAGQITYYINKEQQEPFFGPNFTTPAPTYGFLYKDPMGAIKPQYRREYTLPDPLNTQKTSFEGGLSWIEDSNSQREDIMSKQMIKRNEQRWEPRWGGQSATSS